MESTDFCFENKYVHPSSVVFKTSFYEMMKAVVSGLLCGWLIVAMTVSVTFLLGKVKVDHPCIPQEQRALPWVLCGRRLCLHETYLLLFHPMGSSKVSNTPLILWLSKQTWNHVFYIFY